MTISSWSVERNRGYIGAGSEDQYVMHEHYMFFESEGNPRTDPLIIWTNGGPGGSRSPLLGHPGAGEAEA